MFVVDFSKFESSGDGLVLIDGDHDNPLIAVLLDLHNRRGLQERVDEFALAKILNVILEVFARHVLVFANYLHHDDRDDIRGGISLRDLADPAIERERVRGREPPVNLR
ncbi:hypothetical protein ALC57_13711 [Trachymyrmex cornetzi]|uniref:Uncharacterized protein n=1 Tax=Trachymyrmex cornetzi TaxID=471704 RepID=A0A195DMS2_9HYME|nr:hypothetical protein ALC57_13711 [Trachymyrmex cornetzi]